jgi:hypothetical protein
MQPQKLMLAGAKKTKTFFAAKFKRNVSGTTRLTEKLAKRNLSFDLITQQKRIAPSLACV